MAKTDTTTQEDFEGNALATKEHGTIELQTRTGESVRLTAKELRELDVNGLAQFVSYATSEVIESDQYGTILTDKINLVGKPFVIVHYEFHPGEFGEFVSLWVMTNDGARYIVNDGSTGICAQMRDLADTGKAEGGMIVCGHGLRASDYDKTLSNGATVKATTFYLDTSL
jgi:hypothetical protein